MSDPNEPANPPGPGDESAPPPPPPDSPYGAAPDSGAPTPPPYGGSAGGDGGYGAPPPPAYGQPGVPGQHGPSGAYSPTEALSYGWAKFSASPATLLVPMLVVFVGVVVAAVIVEFVIYGALTGTHDCTKTYFGQPVQTQCGPGLVTSLLAAGLAGALINLVAQVLAAGLYRGAINVVDGKPFGLGNMFEGWDKTQVVIASAIIAVATFVGTILCYFPALIVGFLTQYTLLFIVDKQMTAVDAIKASVSFVTGNFGSTLVYYILAVVVLIVGAILCGVGLLVAAPVALIGLAYTYRRLQGQPVVP